MAIPDTQTRPTGAPRSAGPRITPRAILFGAISGVVLNVYSDYTGMILGSASLVKAQLPMAMLLPFVALILLNIVLKQVVPRFALSSAELLVIYSMSWIVGTVPASGWTTYWGGIVAAPEYYASPENGWREHLFDVMPWWSLPTRNDGVIRTFFEGLPPGSPIPWTGWLPSLFWWIAVSAALVLSGLCLCTIFQRQWEDAERLTFPLAVFPVALTEGFDGASGVPDLFRNRLFWWGFFAVFSVFAWNIAGYFFIDLPRLGVFDDVNTKELPLGRNFPSLYVRIMPPVIGFTYLCNLDILFSFWFFRVLAILQQGMLTRVGFTIGAEGQQAAPPEILALMSHGALAFLGTWSIWAARGHLRRVARAAWHGRAAREDGLVPYRAAVLGFLASTGFVVFWFRGLGMSLPVAVIHVGLMLLAYFTIAKYTALTGFSYLFAPGGKGGAILETFVGTARLSRSEFVGIGLVNSSAFFGNARIPAWPALPHHLRLLSGPQNRGTTVFWTAPLAFVVGLAASCLFIIYLGYAHAGQNLGLTGFQGGNVATFDRMVSAITTGDRTVFDPAKFAVWAIGAAGAWLLTFTVNHVSWWPLHPIGLAFQTSAGSTYYAFSIFLTWAAKSIILRIGGIGLYNRARPFFFGLVVGYVVSLGTSSIVDFLWFPADGHNVHNW